MGISLVHSISTVIPMAWLEGKQEGYGDGLALQRFKSTFSLCLTIKSGLQFSLSICCKLLSLHQWLHMSVVCGTKITKAYMEKKHLRKSHFAHITQNNFANRLRKQS